ncbi:SPRY domain-containing SOCS box protein 3-like isoform X2 [Orbicella faveolata]|uniref:SPRY domain-containing SOCS box protein 3-like isoform X2 n=1 Tax=Orbicella faveolata TaxID=48498 RepID=UPI0009E25687|nr:SPRY domain-containing SOCS box protein 3-like isoform X2 [Orbicella faveolata]
MSRHYVLMKKEVFLRFKDYDWKWDPTTLSSSVCLTRSNKEVLFHPDYSCGTAAAKGSEPLCQGGEYYWEIKMTSAVYGTDMMLGVCTSDLDVTQYKTSFCSLIGKDSNSWGLSYIGNFHHKGKTQKYTSRFDHGAVIGVHLDAWHGKLSFFKDNEPLGVAAKGLTGKTLYPIVSSTAARTKMKLQRSSSTCFSLKYICCAAIGKSLPNFEALQSLPIPPGVKRHLCNELDWILKVHLPSQGNSDDDV